MDGVHHLDSKAQISLSKESGETKLHRAKLVSRARHFVPMGAQFVYISRVIRPNGRPWAQNVRLYWSGMSRIVLVKGYEILPLFV